MEARPAWWVVQRAAALYVGDEDKPCRLPVQLPGLTCLGSLAATAPPAATPCNSDLKLLAFSGSDTPLSVITPCERYM